MFVLDKYEEKHTEVIIKLCLTFIFIKIHTNLSLSGNTIPTSNSAFISTKICFNITDTCLYSAPVSAK